MTFAIGISLLRSRLISNPNPRAFCESCLSARFALLVVKCKCVVLFLCVPGSSCELCLCELGGVLRFRYFEHRPAGLLVTYLCTYVTS